MWQFLYHWIYRDIWCVTYPNWIASGVVVGLAYIYGKKEILKIHHHLDSNHEKLKAHITKLNSK